MIGTAPRIPGAPRASVVIRPGVLATPPGTERYRVRGAGSVSVAVFVGDRFTVVDIEGGQICELAFCDLQGVFDCAAFGARPNSRGEGLVDILRGEGESAVRLRSALQRRGADPAKAESLRIFGLGSAAGDQAEFTVTREGLLLVMAPGLAMDPGHQDTATPVGLRIKRQRMPDATRPVLPEPLADPLQDIRIGARTASSYFVRAGEFIQVIDVSGRQCTDFQAFAARKLDRSKDLAIDATVTRTLLGRSYPTPGLPSKAFDREFEPLVEIVQDTVGRHDAFATACNSRYYEDMGYPGHVNCTDNFNVALAAYGIPPRKGWEAINYFYNTAID
ncbi:MAG TPA: DUF1989 domain-containing protein, partial [Steroidobacteraceae bacterium]|nr:DUF1989 domain-containing protein [Steroidobacteraceae bacterium]